MSRDIILNYTDIFKGNEKVLKSDETDNLLKKLELDPKLFNFTQLSMRIFDYCIRLKTTEDYLVITSENGLSLDPIKNYIYMEAGGMLKNFENGIYCSTLFVRGEDFLLFKINNMSYINIITFIFNVKDYKRWRLIDYFFGVKKVVEVQVKTDYFYFTL